MRRTVVSLVLIATAVGVTSMGASSALAKACAPPRGPGDNQVHSHGLRTHHLRCSRGRRVALSCTRFTFGHAGHCSAIGRRWYCTSRREGPLGSYQRCASGRSTMSIHWDD
jgi:hypothetical protein